jgi:hypothetical protein
MPHLDKQRPPGFMSAEKNRLRDENNTESNSANIQNHQIAGEYFEYAAKHHYEAARYHEAGDHEKAHQSTLIAIGYALLGIECQNNDAKSYALG